MPTIFGFDYCLIGMLFIDRLIIVTLFIVWFAVFELSVVKIVYAHF
jgi:hypothetical protein